MIGPISIQPSEFSKLITIISIAAILNDRVGQTPQPAGSFARRPICRHSVHPRLQTAGLGHVPGLHGHLLRHGLRQRHQHVTPCGILFAAVIAAMPVLWHFLKDYQEIPYHGLHRSGTSTPSVPVTTSSSQNRHRFGHALWQGPLPGDPEPAELPAGKPHGLHLFRHR